MPCCSKREEESKTNKSAGIEINNSSTASRRETNNPRAWPLVYLCIYLFISISVTQNTWKSTRKEFWSWNLARALALQPSRDLCYTRNFFLIFWIFDFFDFHPRVGITSIFRILILWRKNLCSLNLFFVFFSRTLFDQRLTDLHHFSNFSIF